jgi:hypothetical protein
MSESEVHFEIFRQQGRGGGWSLVEALEEREAALERARQMLEEGRAAAVRVVKETYQPTTGDYIGLIIFEEGHTEIKKKNKKVDDIASPSPCFKPDDLYSYHARMTMARLLGEWLGRHKLTVSELIHSAAALEKFEATGTTYQHAIQKVAVAQAADSGFSVAQLVKQLNELCTTAIHRVYKDERRKLFPELQPGQFGPFAQKMGATLDARYVLNGAIARHLAPVRNWDAKLQRLLVLMEEVPAEGPGRALLLTSIDTLVAEMLNGAAALADLLGHNPDLGHALLNLAELFLGTTVNVAQGAGRGINELARSFAKDELPEARAAIAARILAELRGMKRLCPNSLEDEFKMLRRLANQLVRGQGKYLSHEDLIGAFAERSRRLVTHEPLEQFMQEAKTSEERLERLLIVEENIIGAENKRTLSTFMMPIITSNNFEDQVCAGAPAPQRLRRVAELQERVLRSGFQDVQKNQIAMAFDSVAQRIEARMKFLASIEARLTNPIERAQALLKLCTSGVFTQGDLMMKARRLLMASLAKPGFLASYVAQLEQERPGGVDPKEAVAELAAQLESAGIAQEDALRTLAA